MDETVKKPLDIAQTKRSNLHKLISKTYRKVAVGIAITAVVSLITTYLVGDSLSKISTGVFFGGWILMFITLIAVSVRIHGLVEKQKARQATGWFYAIAAIFGIIMTLPFSYYSLNSIGAAFLISGGLFLGLARFGTTTDRDFISWGRTLFILLIGALALALIGAFLGFGIASILINVLIMVLFSVYIVYDSNQLVKRNQDIKASDIDGVSTLMAVDLYLDFINLFQRVLYLIGNNN